ncbi:4Fe-4S ferredoxin [Candidatus Methanophagaceae archaeon]|nr:4Fe-4S ferredoxin [Methanophagales archaeon]
MGFAAKLISGEAKPEDCPLLLEPAYNEILETLKNLLAPFTEKELTGLIIAAENCMGCGICVVVCEENRMNEEVIYGKGSRHKDVQVLRIECGKVRLVDAKKCKRAFEPPEFCRACVDHCPTNAIELVS